MGWGSLVRLSQRRPESWRRAPVLADLPMRPFGTESGRAREASDVKATSSHLGATRSGKEEGDTRPAKRWRGSMAAATLADVRRSGSACDEVQNLRPRVLGMGRLRSIAAKSWGTPTMGADPPCGDVARLPAILEWEPSFATASRLRASPSGVSAQAKNTRASRQLSARRAAALCARSHFGRYGGARFDPLPLDGRDGSALRDLQRGEIASQRRACRKVSLTPSHIACALRSACMLERRRLHATIAA